MIKISIVIPFYNNPELLKEMIESIINQSYEEWELLLVNDGADKKTLECIEPYKLNDHRIKIIKRNRLPKGAQTCRNIGLEKAKGEYICFFDSDDIVLPNCLQTRISFMEENPNLDFGVFRAKTYDQENNKEVLYLGIRPMSDNIKYFINGFLPFAVWTNIYRTKSLRNSNAFWDENILSLQDADFNIQNILTHKLKYSYGKGKIDYLWRVNHNKDSITKKIQSKGHNNSHLYFINKLIKTIHKNYNTKYDCDLALRIHDFSLKFVKNDDTEALKSLQQIYKDNNLTYSGYKRIYILGYINKKFRGTKIDKILSLIIFPKQTIKRHLIAKKFLAETIFFD